MKDFKYHLSITNCRAIQSAEIDLSEITVLAGVNASGKSTIARMFRDLVELSAEYERLLAVQMWNGRMDMWRYFVTGGMRVPMRGARPLYKIQEDLASGKVVFTDAVSMLERTLQEYVSQNANNYRADMFVQRARRILDIREESIDLVDCFRKEAARVLEKFEQRRNTRSYSAYQELLHGNALDEGEIVLTEGGRVVFSNQGGRRDKLDEVSFIKRAIYIESPFKSFPKVITSTELRMDDAYSRVKENVSPESVFRLLDFEKVISGDFTLETNLDDGEDPEVRALLGRGARWMYRRKDGSSFAWEECATGIKALSILSVLHSQGWLDSETLLIIDEPEAHLHPQWIVEYARILLQLSRILRVRIIVTSHSPDMVNAIHTIGTAIGMGDELGFYLAEENETVPFKFNYKGLGNKVGPIFKAYNTSFKRIDDYARQGGL